MARKTKYGAGSYSGEITGEIAGWMVVGIVLFLLASAVMLWG